MYDWIDDWMNDWMDGWIDNWMYDWMDDWMEGRMLKRTMNEWIHSFGWTLSFIVDAKDAGDGSLEITVCRPTGMPIPSNILPMGPGTFDVTFIPIECGPHRANVLYNKETVAG